MRPPTRTSANPPAAPWPCSAPLHPPTLSKITNRPTLSSLDPMKALSRPFLLSLLLAAASLTPAFGRDGPREDQDDHDDGATARVKFSDPSKPGTLKLSLPWAEARVTAIDGNEVIVSSSLDE